MFIILYISQAFFSRGSDHLFHIFPKDVILSENAPMFRADITKIENLRKNPIFVLTIRGFCDKITIT